MEEPRQRLVVASSESPTKPEIDEDWEDVADNYSVVSLPTSDDEPEEPKVTSPPASQPLEPPPTYDESRASFRRKLPSQAPQAPRWPNETAQAPPYPAKTAVTTTVSSQQPFKPIPRPDSTELQQSPQNSPSSISPTPKGAVPIGRATTTRDAADPPRLPNAEATMIGTTDGHKSRSSTGPSAADAVTASDDDDAGLLAVLGAPLRRQPSPLTPLTTQRPKPPTPLETQLRARKLSEEKWDFDTLMRQFGNLETSPTNEEEASSDHQRGILSEYLELDESATNPVVVHKRLESLGECTASTLRRVTRDLAEFDHATVVADTCQSLLTQINELRPILAEYASHHERSNGAPADIPLDPSLSLWITSLKSILSNVRSHRKAWLSRAPLVRERMQTALENSVIWLSDHNKQMNEFLPIIRVDFNDFRTNNMSFPTQTVDDADISRTGFTRTRPTDRVARIRTAMYSLKDQIHGAIVALNDSQSSLTHPASKTASDVIMSLGSTFNAATLALTNNGSEWIDSDLGRAQLGLLSHAEFSSLDPATLQDFAMRLRQISDLIRIDPNERHQWTQDMLQRHNAWVLLDQHQLDALENIASILKEMMMPDHMKTKTEFDHFLKEL
ncbi:hypothetical protein CCHL11_07007 [Colletotrichum chlorophyti]|uniref:Uncharacterized protein n=1 Tax=Colletotrichum chlorophyti TaxID=708187 RepID=A0A1Q8RCE5_9PEZI|nr:hypothetical protein CCHL11_07007 [Colletotrichum chlorophyti]